MEDGLCELCECLSPPTASGVVPPPSTEVLCLYWLFFSYEKMWNWFGTSVQWLLVLHTEGSQLRCFGDPTRIPPAPLQVNCFTGNPGQNQDRLERL